MFKKTLKKNKKTTKGAPAASLDANERLQIAAIKEQGEVLKSKLHSIAGSAHDDETYRGNETLVKSAKKIDEAVALAIQHIDPEGLHDASNQKN